MTRGELIDFAKWGLNVNDSQLPDDISPARWEQLCQMAYKNVWSKFRTQVSKASLLTYSDFTWTSGTSTFTLPTSPVDLTNAVIYAIMGLSSPTVSPITYFSWPVQFLSRNVLTSPYNLTGPFRIFYIPEAETLANDGAIPQLVPPAHHELIAWEMLRVVKMFLDKEIPEQWNDRYVELEMNWFNEWKTRPLADRAGVIDLNVPILRPLA